MAEWGRKEYRKPWPSRRPVWTIGAFFAATLVFAGLLTVQYERSWTAAEGLYWKDYERVKDAHRAAVLGFSSAPPFDGKQSLPPLPIGHDGPGRTSPVMYKPGDVVQYDRGSKAERIERGSFGVVRSSASATDQPTVELADGSAVSCDPKRVYGVNVFHETSWSLRRATACSSPH